MPELPRQSDSADSSPEIALEAAFMYARQLESERLEERHLEPQDVAAYNLQASQGFAMRQLLCWCTTSIIAAIREARDG
jgi:hypothetical protein